MGCANCRAEQITQTAPITPQDIPDISGDELHNIRSFTVRLGTERMFELSRNGLCLLLSATGLGLLWSAARSSSIAASLPRLGVGVASIYAAIETRRRARRVDASDHHGMYSFYMYVWKLFYLSYLLLPFAA